MQFDRHHYSDQTLIDLYAAIVKPRMIEEKMLVLLRQGKITKWFSGIGQEAISVGSAMALEDDEYILPMHRNLGVFTVRQMPFHKLFAQWQGKKSGYTKGRDRSFHFGNQQHHVVGMISHLGPQMGIADGIALANLLENKQKTTLVFTGDGATSEGDFHESVNVAAVWDLPVIFVIENNGYGLSTPSNEQFRCKQMIDKAIGYGMEAVQVDGNNLLEVYHTVKTLAEKMRTNPKPVLLEAMTFRMRGHEEASGTKYVPKELFEEWGKKDPVERYESYLKEIKVLNDELIAKIRAEIKQEIEEGLEIVFPQPDPTPDTAEELSDMYAPHQQVVVSPKAQQKTNKRFINAITDGLSAAMEKYPNLVLMGQDIAEYGGAFKVTEGFVEKFGKQRVRNTPLCESAIVGAALGLSINGYKAMVEMQFADFVTCGFNQIINNLAKIHYRWGQNADVVVRMPTGAGVSAGPFHSQSNEAWFFHTSGLKIVYPSNPYDAKGLLLAALEDPNPYLYFEHKALYRSANEDIPDEYYTIEIGKANLVAMGDDLSIITYGMGVHWAKQITEELGISADILDLRTLLPWDKEAVRQTVSKTGKALVCHEDCLTGGIGGEIAAWISEHCFERLDAPVMREGGLDTAIPFATNLENNFLPKQRIREKVIKLAAY
ncbi:MAG: dehydrogenase [Cytophagales bacterium]|nr:MAG: dehydrogenase [Cytophagales bacterium]